MKTIALPYGKGSLELKVPEEHLAGVLVPHLHEYVPEADGTELVCHALTHPIGSQRLCDLAMGKKKIVVISSDHTRPVPSRIIMPQILKEIRLKNPGADITILIATGLHRATTREELEEKFGKDIVHNEKIVVHDCDDNANLVYAGQLPSGGRLVLNRLAMEADLLVAEGFIEPHFFAGFSGGRKSVLPGIASRESVSYNHNYRFIASDHARTGLLMDNPIHRDMLYAAEKAKLAFIVNVIIDASHQPVFAVAGDCTQAHKKGTDFLIKECQVEAVPADIVVTTNGGYPMDRNIYQAVKGMTAAEASVKEGGVIIMCAEAVDGHGAPAFYQTFRDEPSLSRMMETFSRRKPEETVPDQWQSQILARVLLKAKVVFVSSCSDQMVKDMHMIPAHSLEEAFELAKSLVRVDNYSVTVIPDGVAVMVKE